MTDSSLKEKAIDIHGKKYVLVSDRVRFFNEKYTNGMITTEIIGNAQDKMVVVKATVIPETGAAHRDRYFSAYSQAVWGTGNVNRTAALENAETSAVGRALALMGIGVLDSIASADEVNKAITDERNVDMDDVYDRGMASSKCKHCGAPMKKSSKGKWYCSALCWKNDPIMEATQNV